MKYIYATNGNWVELLVNMLRSTILNLKLCVLTLSEIAEYIKSGNIKAAIAQRNFHGELCPGVAWRMYSGKQVNGIQIQVLTRLISITFQSMKKNLKASNRIKFQI